MRPLKEQGSVPLYMIEGFRKFELLYFVRGLNFYIPIWSFYYVSFCGVSMSTAVSMYSLIFLVNGITDLPTSSWADRFGRKLILALGSLFYLVGALAVVSFPSMLGLWIMSITWGLSWSFASGTNVALLHDNLKYENKEAEFAGIYAHLLGFWYVGRIVAFIGAGFLFLLDPRAPYVCIVLSACLEFYTLQRIVEHPYEKSSAKNDWQQVSKAGELLLCNRPLLTYIVIALAIFIAGDQLWIVFNPQLQAAGLTPVAMGMSYALAAASSILGTYLSKRWMRAGRETLCIAVAPLLFASGALLFVVKPTIQGAFVAQGIASIGYGFIFVGSYALFNRHIPSSHRSTCLSIIASLQWALMGMLGIVGGLLLPYSGYSAVPITVCVAGAALIPLAIWSVRSLNRD